MWEGALSEDIPTDLGQDPTAALKIMVGAWGDLVRNTTTLGRLTSIIYTRVRENQEQMDISLSDVEFAVSLLGTKLGDHPVSLGTDSVYKILDELVTDTVRVQQEVARLDSPEVEAARQSKLEGAVGGTVVENLRPLVSLFRALSSSPDTPGDLLEQRLRSLESGTPAGLAAGSGIGGWGNGTVSNLSAVPAGNPTAIPAGMLERLNFLEAQVREMQDELAFARVKVGTLTFVSRTQTKAWLNTNGVPGRACLFFLDAMSLLALMHSGSESARSAAEFASVTKKVGYSSTDEALVVTSFSLVLPEAFGSLPTSGISRDSRMLPALPTFREWDGGDGYNGLKVSLSDKLGEFVPQMGNYYRSSLSGEALNVATKMLMASKLFIFELASWMNSAYTDTMARTTASAKEAWALISHCVHVVFKLLRDARSSGARWTPEEGGGDVELVWAQLQCQRVMTELRTAGFGAHPALSHVLNLHIQDNVVSRSRFEALEKKFAEVERIAKEARKAADRPSPRAGGTPRGEGGEAAGAARPS